MDVVKEMRLTEYSYFQYLKCRCARLQIFPDLNDLIYSFVWVRISGILERLLFNDLMNHE